MRADWSLILFVAVIVLLIWFVMRGRRREGPKLQVALAMIANVNDNLKIMETHRIDPLSTKKFKAGAWKSYSDKHDFLDAHTVPALKESFNLIAEFNNTINSAKKDKNPAILQGLPLDKLKDPLSRSKDGLVLWLRANLQTEMRHGRGPLGF